jgi:WD40 repeat protein
MNGQMGTHDLDKFVRHRGPLTSVAMIPHQDWIVTSGYDGAVARFNLASNEVKLLGYHDHLVNHICVNDQGNLVASSSSDYTIGIWSTLSNTMVMRLVGHQDDVEAFVFIGEHTGASASRDRTIVIWDLRSGSASKVLKGHDKDVLSLVYFDGRLYSTGDDMTLRIWDVDSGELIRSLGPFESETDTCTIDIVRHRAVLGCDDGCLRVFDLDSGDLLHRIDAHASGVKKVAASPKNGDLLSASYDQKIIVWDGSNFIKKFEVERLTSTWERSLNWSPRGDLLLGGTFDGTVLAWDAQTGKLLKEMGERNEPGNACFNEIAVSDSGRVLAVSDDGIIRSVLKSGMGLALTESVNLRGGRVLMNAVAFDDDLQLAATGAHDHLLHIFDMDQGHLLNQRDVALNEGPINTIRVARQKDYRSQIFAGCYSGRIVRVGRDSSILGTVDVHDGAVKALRLHSEDPVGVSCGADGSLLGWSFSGGLLRRYTGHEAIINDVDFAPDGARICSVSRDFTAKVYDVESGVLRASFALGRRSLKSTCFFDDTRIMVGDYWGHLISIDLEHGKIVSRRIAGNGISSLARCQGYLIASSYDGSIYLVRPDDLEVVGCLRLMSQRSSEN